MPRQHPIRGDHGHLVSDIVNLEGVPVAPGDGTLPRSTRWIGPFAYDLTTAVEVEVDGYTYCYAKPEPNLLPLSAGDYVVGYFCEVEETADYGGFTLTFSAGPNSELPIYGVADSSPSDTYYTEDGLTLQEVGMLNADSGWKVLRVLQETYLSLSTSSVYAAGKGNVWLQVFTP